MTKKNSSNHCLYLDTSEPEATLSIYGQDSKGTWREVEKISWWAHRELSKTLLGRYKEILKKAGLSQKDLSGICLFLGPGSFTGLRVGFSFANGLAYALKIPVYTTKKKGVLDLSKPQESASPEYGASPRITRPKK